MQRKIFFIFSVVVWLLLSSCSGNDKKLNEKLNKMADDLNESVPVQLDDHTMFMGAHVTADNVFQYNYQIIHVQNPDSLLDATEHQILTNLKEAFKMNPDLRIFTQHHLNIEYIYSDSNGMVIRKIEITPENYK